MLTRNVSDLFSVGSEDWEKIGSFRAGQIFREAVEIADPDVGISRPVGDEDPFFGVG